MKVSEHALPEIITILEWTEDTPDTLAWHLPYSYEIKYGARLMVHDFQQALFFVNNTLADIYNPGLYTLTRENMPRMSVLNHWDDNFRDSFHADIYFVKSKYFIEQHWEQRNNENSRFNLCGTYDVKVINARKLIHKMELKVSFKISQITQLVEQMVDGMLPHAAKENPVALETTPDENVDFATFIQESINIELNNYGLLLRNFTIRLSDPT